MVIKAGHEAVLSNRRGPDTLADLVAELGPQALAATPREAAEAGDLIVVTIPLAAYTTVPVEELNGKVVIDTNNYYPDRDGRIPELDNESTTTSELLQGHLPGSQVIKAFNNIYYTHLGNLARPSGAPDRSTLAIAGDDSEAKATVTNFLDSIGYETLDAGPLAEGWRFQRDTAAYSRPYIGPDGDIPQLSGEFNPGLGVRATREELEAALASAVRYRFM
ncbi:NADPH-dependent F420 reductase [Arthrobacter sp. KNU40]|uniref:NADPH-dependent F420 reductase n=1 Tax=Arthrobacter sp. KNU40 TaxID=3447965 RepID=UPI003F63D847